MRRALRCLVMIAAALATAFAPSGAAAQDFPTRPIRMIVAFSAGGTTDYVARLLADRVKGALGQAVVVENKPGANGAIGADYVSKAEPDGYTLFFSTAGALSIIPNIRTDLPYDPRKSFAPILPTARNTVLFAVNSGLGLASAQDMIAYAKQEPGALTVAITGVGAISHLAVEMPRSELTANSTVLRAVGRIGVKLLSGS